MCTSVHLRETVCVLSVSLIRWNYYVINSARGYYFSNGSIIPLPSCTLTFSASGRFWWVRMQKVIEIRKKNNAIVTKTWKSISLLKISVAQNSNYETHNIHTRFHTASSRIFFRQNNNFYTKRYFQYSVRIFLHFYVFVLKIFLFFIVDIN